jgi:hypothetical protein
LREFPPLKPFWQFKGLVVLTAASHAGLLYAAAFVCIKTCHGPLALEPELVFEFVPQVLSAPAIHASVFASAVEIVYPPAAAPLCTVEAEHDPGPFTAPAGVVGELTLAGLAAGFPTLGTEFGGFTIERQSSPGFPPSIEFQGPKAGFEGL